ncbi:MAG: hypothetical protein WA160_05280 [Pseudobdellovibrio sp.]
MNSNSLKTISALLFAFGLSTARADMKSDKEAINTACVEDAKTANCGTETVGKGLLKCIHSYKKEHKDFKVSDACKSAMKKHRADKKEKKEEKK